MSSNTTRAPYGAFFTSASLYGGGAPPLIDGCTTNAGDFISNLSSIKSVGARACWKFGGSDSFYRDSNLSFSMGSWKARADLAAAKTNAQQMGNFVQDGTLVAWVLADDIVAGSPVYAGGAPTYADLEEMARYAKSIWSQVPTCVRAPNTYLRDICIAAGASSYKTLDFGWAQWRYSQGNVQTFYQNNVNAGRQVGLGCMAGINLLNGGSGLTAPWNQKGCSQSPTLWGMSPDEIRAAGNAFSITSSLIGWFAWAHKCDTTGSSAYYDNPDINVALKQVANAAIGRLMGPINFRDISGSTSGSTSTVIGGWSFVGTGGLNASQNVTSLGCFLPDTVPQGALLGILAYSRDSLKSPVAPSGYSEAARVSGTSAKGGELAMFFKVAGATETAPTVNFGSTAADQVAQMTKMFCFTGNISGQSLVLSTVGSDSSWAGQTGFGPVKGGFQSAASDALVLICAAKANDLGFISPPPPEDAISATTHDSETWNRAFIRDTGSGADASMFMDYAFLAGQPSITTKTWSQLSKAPTSAHSAAGCGFIVSFRPAAVVAGTPPVINDLSVEDAEVTFSVSSTLSFTAVSAGSTPITWSLTSGPSNVTLNSSTGNFQWSPMAVGQYVILLKATNSFGSDTGTIIANVVSGSNSAPVITHPGDKTVLAQDTLSFIVEASDPDGDTILFSLDPSAPSGTRIIAETGHFIWKPTGEQGPGTYPVVVQATDGQNTSASTFTVQVVDVPWTKVTGPANRAVRINPDGSVFRRI